MESATAAHLSRTVSCRCDLVHLEGMEMPGPEPCAPAGQGSKLGHCQGVTLTMLPRSSSAVETSSSSHESIGTAVANVAGWQLEPLPPYGRCITTGESIEVSTVRCRAGPGAAATAVRCRAGPGAAARARTYRVKTNDGTWLNGTSRLKRRRDIVGNTVRRRGQPGCAGRGDSRSRHDTHACCGLVSSCSRSWHQQPAAR